jgi:hypothetical protein
MVLPNGVIVAASASSIGAPAQPQRILCHAMNGKWQHNAWPRVTAAS